MSLNLVFLECLIFFLQETNQHLQSLFLLRQGRFPTKPELLILCPLIKFTNRNAVNIFLRIKILQYQVGCRNVACIFRFVKINVNNDAYGPMGCLLLRIAIPCKVTHRSKLLREI